MHMRSLSCGFGWWLNFDTKKTSCHRFLPTVSENGMFWCIPVSFLSSAGSANSITGQKLSVDRISRVSVYLSVCVCMYTRIAQIITDSHRPCNSACADLLMNSDHIQKKLDCESKKHAVHIVRWRNAFNPKAISLNINLTWRILCFENSTFGVIKNWSGTRVGLGRWVGSLFCLWSAGRAASGQVTENGLVDISGVASWALHYMGCWLKFVLYACKSVISSKV